MRKAILFLVLCLASVASAFPPAPVFNGAFGPANSVPLSTTNGGTSFTGAETVGMVLVTVYYMPWYNAGELDLSDPADVAKLKDRVQVQVTTAGGQTDSWEYDGPALATWNSEIGEVNGATYNCEKQGPNGGVGMFQNCVITLIQ